MPVIDAPYLIAFFRQAAQRLEQDRTMLCILDGEIGDGDHGTSMANGFAAIARQLTGPGSHAWRPEEVLHAAAKAFIGEVGATVGPLYATAFLDGAACLEDQCLQRSDIGDLMQAFAQGIARRGQANLGDKTMLDVWLPAAQTAQVAAAEGLPAVQIARGAAETARLAAEGTASMIARRGRAARLNERSLGKIDPGAASASMLIAVFADLERGRG